METVRIPVEEYRQRQLKAAKLIQEMGLDVLIVNSTEADYANVRYFSGYWPLFERAGVAISPEGKTAVMVGLESDIFAKDMGCIDNVHVLMEYRESADPEAPEIHPHTFHDVMESIGVKGEKIRIGVAAWIDTTMVIMDGIRADYPEAEIVRADSIMKKLRSVKSDNEIACIRKGFEIAEYAVGEVLKAIKPGMTETQVVGIAQRAIYEKGAEYESLPMYIFSEKSTSHAISRPRPDRVIGKNDIVQINLGAKVDGYSPAIGIPICMGKLSEERKRYIAFCLEAHEWTIKQLKAGVIAGDISKGFYKLYCDRGYQENYLYGPCHGTGMIEVEPPWMETSSEYALEKNMTFQIDTFLKTAEFGVRWEEGCAITENGCEILCGQVGKLYELGF